MSVNFGAADSGAGETATDEVGEVSGDAAGEVVDGRVPTKVAEGV